MRSRTPEQLALARSFFADEDGIVTFSEEANAHAAEIFRRLVSPRKRGADIAIAATALTRKTVLLTHNRKDLAAIPDLEVEPLS